MNFPPHVKQDDRPSHQVWLELDEAYARMEKSLKSYKKFKAEFSQRSGKEAKGALRYFLGQPALTSIRKNLTVLMYRMGGPGRPPSRANVRQWYKAYKRAEASGNEEMARKLLKSVNNAAEAIGSPLEEILVNKKVELTKRRLLG